MSDEKRKLASRSNKLLDALRRLRDTEKRKRQEPISSPPFHELADQLTRDSREVFNLAREQDRLGDKAKRGSESIDDIDESGQVDHPKKN